MTRRRYRRPHSQPAVTVALVLGALALTALLMMLLDRLGSN
jgi:hypothetical protein